MVSCVPWHVFVDDDMFSYEGWQTELQRLLTHTISAFPLRTPPFLKVNGGYPLLAFSLFFVFSPIHNSKLLALLQT